jgi:hypothetical protein
VNPSLSDLAAERPLAGSLMVGVLKLDHVAAGDGHPFCRYGGPTASHVPSGIGLAERALRRQAIHRINYGIAALCRRSPGAETDALGRGAAEDDRLDTVVLKSLVKAVAQKLVWSPRFLIDDFPFARCNGRPAACTRRAYRRHAPDRAAP